MSEYLSGEFDSSRRIIPTIIQNKTVYFDDDLITADVVEEDPFDALEHYGGQVAILERSININQNNKNNCLSTRWLGFNNNKDAKDYIDKHGEENFEDELNNNFSGNYATRSVIDNPHFLERMNERRKKIDHLELLGIIDEIVDDYELSAEEKDLLKYSIYEIETNNRLLANEMLNSDELLKNRAYLNKIERTKMFDRARMKMLIEFDRAIATIEEVIDDNSANSLTKEEIAGIDYYAREITESLRSNYELINDTTKTISIIIQKIITTSRLKNLGADLLSVEVLDDINIWMDDINSLITFTYNQSRLKYTEEIKFYIENKHHWA